MAGREVASTFGRDRVPVLASILVLTVVAWVYLWLEANRMGAMEMPGSAPAMSPWSPLSLLLVFVMWAVMMVGMMLPSALPAILLYGSLARPPGSQESRLPSVWTFTAGYLAVWTLFSAGATLLQAWLAAGGLLDPMMTSASVYLSAGVLVTAGVYQWLPLKDACLRRCRNPLQMFLFHWRSGAVGAFRMGVEHGAFCVGCCWALMLVLFAAGVMNLLWVALIAVFVLVEKLLPGGHWPGRLAGIALVAVGIWLPIAG